MTTAATYEQILFEQRGRVALITLNRPEKMNAWTWEMAGEIEHAIAACNDDRGVGAIVVTGAGRAYCAGADVRGFRRAEEARDQATTQEEKVRVSSSPRRGESPATLFRRSKPIIGAINGASIGVGMTMTLPMDLRIASEQARFSMRFVKMGITPEVASTLYLPQIVGLPNALELIMTGKTIDAETALRMGLVSRVVPADRLIDETLVIADEIAQNPTDQVRAAKAMVHEHMVLSDMSEILKREGREILKAYETPEHREAIRAFMEKREPRFHD
jgi:2-(1,2-epoxy-1,2-dihydrophenyl)acetyl-CoA isomerase